MATADGTLINTGPHGHLDQSELLDAFQEHIEDLHKEFIDGHVDRKKDQFRVERKRRDAFRAFLGELKGKGMLGVDADWTAVIETVREDDRARDMIGQNRPSLIDLLFDAAGESYEQLYKDSSAVRASLRALNEPIETLEALTAHVAAHNVHVDTRHLPIIFQEIISRRAKKADRAKRRFIRLLRRTSGMTKTATWSDIRPIIEGRSAFRDISDESARESAFNELVIGWESGLGASSSDSSSEDERRERDRRNDRKSDRRESDRKSDRREKRKRSRSPQRREPGELDE